MAKKDAHRIKITHPKRDIAHKIYRVTIGKNVYIGRTQDLDKRAHFHVDTKGRKVYDAFHTTNHDMVIEYITGSRDYDKAKKLEAKHIKAEFNRVGNRLLNKHHAKKK